MRIMAAAALLLLVSLVTAVAADNMSKERTEEEIRRIFMEWKAEHSMTYSSTAEEERGYEMFKHGLRDIDQQWHKDGYSTWSWDRERSEKEARRIFEEWKARNGKIYSSIAHEENQYAIFKDALRSIDRHNGGYAIGVHSSTQGINTFSDLTMEEYSVVCCGYVPLGSQRSPAELRRRADIRERLRLVYAPSSM